MKAIKIWVILLTVPLFIFTSCDKGNDEEIITKKFLVDHELYTPSIPFRVDNAKLFFEAYDLNDLASKLKYDIQIFKITYKTLFEGDTILVSGVVAAPVQIKQNETFPILSFQHGTIVMKSDAPSVNIANEFMTYIASTGMIVVMADYIGFGASSAEFHPFMHNQYTVNAVLDMIRASKEFVAIEKPCKSNDQLFMLGYSQGGSATVGALSAIENNNANSDISVTAAVSGSGAYDLLELRNWIVKQVRYEQPYYLGYLLESYSRYANVDTDYSLVFSKEFAPLIPDMFDGFTSPGAINDQFGTTHVGELFNDDFENEEKFITNPAYASLIQAFIDNKIDAWPITTSLSIYYGSDDNWMPGDQSLKLYQQFQANGVGVKVKIKRLDGKNHITAFEPTLVESLDWFLSFNDE